MSEQKPVALVVGVGDPIRETTSRVFYKVWEMGDAWTFEMDLRPYGESW